MTNSTKANEIIALNAKKVKVESLEEYASELVEEVKADFENVVGQDSLTRFDKPKSKSRRKNNRRRNPNKSQKHSKTTRSLNNNAK